MRLRQGILSTIPLALAAVVITQFIYPWLPAEFNGVSVARCLNIAFAVAIGLDVIIDRRPRRRRRGDLTVMCLACGELAGLSEWREAQSCPRCGHKILECVDGSGRQILGPSADEEALGGAQRWPAVGAGDVARARLGSQEKRRIRGRLDEVMGDEQPPLPA